LVFGVGGLGVGCRPHTPNPPPPNPQSPILIIIVEYIRINIIYFGYNNYKIIIGNIF